MLMLLALLATEPLAPPDEATSQGVRAAIWSDLEQNALIGNHSWTAGLSYLAANDEPDVRLLHIEDLRCGGGRVSRCEFVLLRDGGPVMFRGEQAPDRLRCRADLVRDAEGWGVKHRSARGHTRTSLQCETAGT